MTSRISQVTLDVADVGAMAQFWSAVLGYTGARGEDGCAMLNPPQGGEPTLWLQAGASLKSEKLRCHIDLRTIDSAGELDRLLALGARRVDVGQRGDPGLTVLTIPRATSSACSTVQAPRRPGQADEESPE